MAGLQRQPLVSQGVRLRDRLRLLPAARARPVRGGAADPRRRRARRRRRRRAGRRPSTPTCAGGCSDESERVSEAEHQRRRRRTASAGPRSPSAAPRRDGAAQRPADPRPDLVGGRGARRRRLDRGRLGPEAGAGPWPARPRRPLLRGPLRLAEAMAVVPLARLRLRSARLPFEDPSVLARRRRERGRLEPAAPPRPSDASAASSRVALIGALPALAALRDRDLASYHARRAQGDRRLRAGARPGGGAEGARALRLEPDRPDARPVDRGPGADRAAASTTRARSRAGSPRSPASAARSSCSSSPSATRSRRSAARSTGPATRSSGWSRPASRPPSSSRSAWPRWTKSYGWSARLPIRV